VRKTGARPRPAAVWIDGEPLDRVPADDRGLQYGDGLFETIRLRDAAAPHWERHMARLERGCAHLDMAPPSPAVLAADRDAAARERPDGVLRIAVTRGSGGRGYASPAEPAVRRITSVAPSPEPRTDEYRRGIRVAVCDTRAATTPDLAGLKHLGRLEHVLASNEIRDSGHHEGLMLDCAGGVVGGTMTNVFAVDGDRLMTPRVDCAGVAGTTRERVMAWADRAGMEIGECELTMADCLSADELFVCNAIRGIVPVRELAGQEMPRQRVTRRIMTALGEAGGPSSD